jgi:uncharacterized protein
MLAPVVICLYTGLNPVSANDFDCQPQQSSFVMKNICSSAFEESRQHFHNQSLTAFLITDAPIQLLQDTHKTWYQRVKKCKSKDCLVQQFDFRVDQLNFFTSMNQSMTQHYLKYESGQLATSSVHLQIHQLSKNNLKIEGSAYRNPNNKLETQMIPFLAYSTSQDKHQITNNESDCKYDFDFQKSILKISTLDKNCERFSGVYRLYD